MCAIGGEIDYSKIMAKEQYHDDMLSSMTRRGPDADGVYVDDNVVLSCMPLSVMYFLSSGVLYISPLYTMVYVSPPRLAVIGCLPFSTSITARRA